MKQSMFTKVIAVIGIAAALGLGSVAPAQASAPTVAIVDVPTSAAAPLSSANCSNGRCWILFSNAETAALGRGQIPAPPAWVPAQIKAVYFATAYVHKWIAADYARRGLCSAFILSIYPWEGRGYTSYKC